MKKSICLTAVVFLVGVGWLRAGDDAVQKDRKAMAGTWRPVVHETDGKKFPDEQLAKTRSTYDADGVIIVKEDGKTTIQATIKIDPAKKPKQAEVSFTEGPLKGKAVLGIYEVDGDNMKLCFALGKDRPTDFVSKPGSGIALLVYKRDVPPKLFTSSTGMKLVWLAPGTFVMGSSDKEEGRGKSEAQRKVTLTKGFFIGLYTVTQEQWQGVMGSNPSHFQGDKNLPAENVSWTECLEFCRKLSDKDKKPYRLPTEAEWEYACRAGTTTPFHFGDTIAPEQANYNADEIYGKGKKGVSRGQTTPVGSFPANAWGLFDMHGNVWQWCQDRYEEYPAKDVADPQGPATGESRVVRGGARYSSPASCRSASRHWYLPGYRASYIGCRVCYTE